jgi:hypothetical protein
MEDRAHLEGIEGITDHFIRLRLEKGTPYEANLAGSRETVGQR